MYAIDKIENNIVVAEEIETGKQINFQKESFPFELHEGLMFSLKEGKIIMLIYKFLIKTISSL